MKLARLAVLAVAAVAVVPALASAGAAVDYPPTTSVQTLGSTVSAPPTSPPATSVEPASQGLPRTGSDTAPWFWAGAGLVGVGAIVAAAARQRHRSAHP
jgi:LPXTG-motif cell wall-anchored protein